MQQHNVEIHLTPLDIARSIQIINKRAKQVQNPSFLYQLKYEAIQKLLSDHDAKKICLHYFKRVQQFHFYNMTNKNINNVFVLVECANYYFHYPASNQDKQLLSYEIIKKDIRNPPTKMSYFIAKRNLTKYLKNNEIPSCYSK